MAHHYSPYQSASLRKKNRNHNVKKVAFRSTNPGQFQESALGSLPDFQDEGVPSPSHKLINEHLSPIRGCTMKEYDQQIHDLRKENFNLKLRIFILEDTMEKKFGGSTDDIHKHNIELQVEVESLKKELATKQELLVKAAHGLETMETTYKSKIEEMHQQFSNQQKALENEIAQLQQSLERLQTDQDGDTSCKNDYYQQAFLPFHTEKEKPNHSKEMEHKIEELQAIIENNQIQIQDLQNELTSKDACIKQEEVNSLKRHKLIQGLVIQVQNKQKEIIHLQEQVKERETDIMLIKDELVGLKEEKVSRSTDDASSVETLKYHSEEMECLCKKKQDFREICEEKNRLENALHEKDDIIKKIEMELNEKLQAKEETIKQLNQNINYCYTVFRNCLHILGCLESNEITENDINSLIELIKQKLKDNEAKIQMALEENVKRLKEKDNELIQYQETVYDLENIQKTLKNDLNSAQTTIRKLEEQIKERENTIQKLLSLIENQREELNNTSERRSSLLTDKDAMISRLQKSLIESEKGLEDTHGIRDISENATKDTSSLQKCITEKDELIEELISDRNKSLIESERSKQGLMYALREKDIALKEIHARLIEEQNGRVNERDVLEGDLKKKITEIKNLENQIKKLEEQHEAVLSKLQIAVDEKDNTIQMLIDTNAKKEREFQHFLASHSGITSENKTNAEILSMMEEATALKNSMISKEKHLMTIKMHIKKLIAENHLVNNVNKLDSFSQQEESEMSLEEYLNTLEESLKVNQEKNQQLQEDVELAKKKVMDLKNLLEGCTKHDSVSGADNRVVTTANDLQANLNFLLTEMKFMVNLSELLQRQLELNTNRRSSFQPEIVIDLALQIDNLRSETDSEIHTKKNREENNDTFDKPNNLDNSSTTIHGAITQSNTTSNVPFVTLVLLLNETKNEVQMLKDKLSGTENTVRLLGSKVKHYRRLLCDSGLGAILSPSTPSEHREVSFFSNPPLCQQEKETSQDFAMSSSFFRSRRSVSADDVSYSVNPISAEDNQALSAEDVLTTIPATKTDYNRSYSEAQDQIQIPSTPNRKNRSLLEISCMSPNKSVFEICLQRIREGTKSSRQSHGSSSLNVEKVSIGTYSPCTSDNINEFGQSNDILALKEEILWLKLHLEQNIHQLHEYEQKKKSLSNAAMVDAHCQTEWRSEKELSITPLKSSIEAPALYQEINSLKIRLHTLLSEIPEGSHSAFIKLQQQELQSLRNHLYESHESCEVLRIRLEELADFMERLLHFDENGSLDLSRFTPQRIAFLQKQIAQSRELSNNLSQSLLVDGDISIISSCAEFSILRDHESTHLTECSIIQDHTSLPDKSKCYRLENIKNNQSVLKDEAREMELNRLKEENDQKNQLICKLNLELRELKEQIIIRSENSLHRTRATQDLVGTSPRKNICRKLLPALTHSQENSENQKVILNPVESSNVNLCQRYIVGAETPEKEVHKTSSDNIDISQFLDAESSNFESHWKHSENKSGFVRQSESSYDDLILLLNNKSDSSLKKSPNKPNNKQMAYSETNEMRTIAADQEQVIIAECVGGAHPFHQLQKFKNGAFNRKSSITLDPHKYSEQDDISHQRLKMAISPSDSESWSEPDRDVSQQRMGLEPEDGFFRSPGERSHIGRSPKTLRHKYQKSESSNTEYSTESFKMGTKIITPSGDPKLYNDHWGIWHLQEFFQRWEEKYSSLHSQLQTHLSLFGDMIISPSQKSNHLPSSVTARKPVSSIKSDSVLITEDLASNSNKIQELLQDQLKEIRTLRYRLEQSIQTNDDQLRERLGRKVALQENKIHMLTKQSEEYEKSLERRNSKVVEEKKLTEDLQQQIKLHSKQKLELESEIQLLNEKAFELSEKVRLKDDQVNQLQRNLSDRDDVGHQLKQANERLQNSVMHFQTSLNDKESVCKELREANARMQRTLDSVDKLIAEKELELTSVQKQHLQLINEMKLMKKSYMDETNRLSNLILEVKEKAKESEESLHRMNASELQEIEYKYQEEIDKLSKLLKIKEKLLEEYEQKVENIQQELIDKEEHKQVLQSKFDEMSAAILEMEKHLEEEHGQNLSLQQKVNVLNKSLVDKDKNLKDTFQKQLEMANKHSENVNKIKELQIEVSRRVMEVSEKDQQILSLKNIIEKTQDEITEKKKVLKRQLEIAQHLEEKVEVLSSSATEKEQRCQEECAVKRNLQQQIKSAEEETEKVKKEMKKSQDHCRQLEDHLSAQEKKYLDLQNKLDERGDVIRRLEDELHKSWDENEKLQTQIISAQTMLHETNNLNKSMKTELHVYERLHSSFVSSTDDSKENKSPTRKIAPNIEMLLDEIRSLRSQLELSIQTSCALRTQLEGQFSTMSEDVPTKDSSTVITSLTKGKDDSVSSSKESLNIIRPTKEKSSLPSKKTGLSKSITLGTDEEKAIVKIPSVSTESGQFSDIESAPFINEIDKSSSRSSDYVLTVPNDKVSKEHEAVLSKIPTNNGQQKLEKLKPSRLYLTHESLNTKFQRETFDVADMHSVYSSPDLGIESDPSPFTCLETKLNHITEEHLWDIHKDHKKDSALDLRIDSDRRLLYAIGRLDDYELLKKEIEEGIAVLKGLQARVKDRLRQKPSSSPSKMDSFTWKEVQSSTSNIDICLGRSLQIIGFFWTAMLPSEQGVNREEIEKLTQENYLLKKKVRHQKRSLNDYIEKLAATNRTLEGMKKGITKQLLQTHDVLKKTKGNLQEQTKLMANCK